ncbi:hypothetical protein [Mycobacterium sp. AT1]|uniref:hypothetical protein n=1 Tax=Mycobacterium sp. AT1 TaxID=1961706 RepID=UPI001E2DC51F|nr:hypothetical protein [Mycobacterium sp. AT1]
MTPASDDTAGVAGTNVSLRAAAATVHETGESGGEDGDPPEWGPVGSTTAAGTAVTASCVTGVGVGAVLAASGVVACGDSTIVGLEATSASEAVTGLAGSVSLAGAAVFEDGSVSGFAVAAADPTGVDREPRCGLPVIVTVRGGFPVETFVGVPASSCAPTELVA